MSEANDAISDEIHNTLKVTTKISPREKGNTFRNEDSTLNNKKIKKKLLKTKHDEKKPNCIITYNKFKYF